MRGRVVLFRSGLYAKYQIRLAREAKSHTLHTYDYMFISCLEFPYLSLIYNTP
jgi:hypothetical protein